MTTGQMLQVLHNELTTLANPPEYIELWDGDITPPFAGEGPIPEALRGFDDEEPQEMSHYRPRAYRVYADPHANIDDVKSLLADLTWIGGCRDPDEPAFCSLQPRKVRVTRAKELDLK